MVNRYIGPSVRERLATDTWYENRFIRLVACIPDHVRNNVEPVFVAARLDDVKNAEALFAELRGSDRNYDVKLPDLLAEILFLRWARRQGIESIEKLHPSGDGKTPDFKIATEAGVVLAEAKHFRPRDFLLDFICDRLEGLAMAMGWLQQFGLTVGAGDAYVRNREQPSRPPPEQVVADVRERLSGRVLRDLERMLALDPAAKLEVTVQDVPLTITRTGYIHRVRGHQFGGLDGDHTFGIIVTKIRRLFLRACDQIRDFAEKSGTTPTRAVVLLKGAGPEEIELGAFWDLLCHDRAPRRWQMVHAMLDEGEKKAGVPVELLVRQGVSPKYGPFPRSPDECPQLAVHPTRVFVPPGSDVTNR